MVEYKLLYYIKILYYIIRGIFTSGLRLTVAKYQVLPFDTSLYHNLFFKKQTKFII